MVTVLNKDTNKSAEYPIDSFNSPLPPGAVLTALGEPAYSQIIPSGKTWSFFVHINEVASDGDFGKKFT